MPARLEEVENAMEEGVIFDFLTNPTRFSGDDRGMVKAMEEWRWSWVSPIPRGGEARG